ncbi:VirD4-like conjugal transfer protein, CD1115 family [Syntrophomonas zehnderi]|uniref:VirD4-like conjugal transfer protein, CD1115 family n=1 Tax=Syntrophomonas zehnderi TaxID=404335 RepID=UPI001A9A6DD1|nr:type IV secretory system conjugative DNA transfer family protein [Syntrophomonas zehnderi]
MGANINKEKYWTVDDDTHVLLIGTTRSGKSRRVIIPSIWHLALHGESMVICDLKKELQPITKEYLRRKGYQVITLDLRNPTTGNRWNILHPVLQALKDNNTALAIQHADDIAHTLSYDPRYRGDPIWPSAKKALISALILAVAVEAPPEHKHMSTAFHLLANFGQDGGRMLDAYFNTLPLTHPARSPYQVYQMSTDKMRSSIATDTLTSLQLFGVDPAIVWMISAQDHDMAAVGKEKTAVFLVIPDERTNRNVLASLYVQQSYGALVDLANHNRGRLPVRVNYLLDEFGNIPAITDFTTKITTAGGRGIRFTLALQGLDQLSEHYPNRENTIIGQCWTWIYILTADQKTAEIISVKAGNYTVATESYNSSAQMSGSRSEGVTQGLTSRPLVMKDEVMRWPVDSVLILRTRLQPARLPLPDISEWPIAKELDLQRMGVPDQERMLSLPEPWLPTTKKNRSSETNCQETQPSAGDVLGF